MLHVTVDKIDKTITFLIITYQAYAAYSKEEMNKDHVYPAENWKCLQW